MRGGKNTFISAQEISSQYKVPYSTVNHYTNLGLFSVVKRIGNTRFYCREKVEKCLSEVSRLKDEGYPLHLILKRMNET